MEMGTGTEAIKNRLEHMHLGQDTHSLGDGDDRKEGPLELEEVCYLTSHKVCCLSWSQRPCNGSDHMIASGESNTIIWHYKDSKWSVLQELPNGGKGFIQSCAWSLNGTLLAVGGLNSNIAIWEYNECAFKLIAQLHGPCNEIIKTLSWNNEGLLLSCSDSGNVCIIGKSKGTYDVECRICECKISETSCAIWNPDDITFAVAGYKKIKIYHTQMVGGQGVRAYHIHTIDEKERSGHKSGVEGISYWKDGHFMASAGADGSMKFWSIRPDISSSRSMTISITSGKELASEHIFQYRLSQDTRGGFSCCDWSRCNNESIGYLIGSACLFNDIYIFVQYDGQKGHRKGYLAYRLGTTKVDAHNGRITDLKWHPKRAGLLASAGGDGIKIWKVNGKAEYSREPMLTSRVGRKSSSSQNGTNGAPDPTSTKRMRH